MQKKLGILYNPKIFLIPKNNHWSKKIILTFAFILFDYFSTLIFCRAPFEEANPYVRIFMETFGIPIGLTLFVIIANLPIYSTLSLDSHLVGLPSKISIATESFVDFVFAWFVAGLHFSGGASWFWPVPVFIRQLLGTILYLVMAFLFVRPHK